MAAITINGITFDPADQASTLGERGPGADARQTSYILVQTNGPLPPDSLQKLTATGAEVLEYVPETTYICRYAPADLSPIRALPFVTWVGPYLQTFKIAPELSGAGPAVTSRGPGGDSAVTVDVVVQKSAMSDDVVRKIAAAAGLDPSDVQVGAGKVRLKVDPSKLPAVAGVDEVRHIEEFVPPVLFNDVARGILAVDTVQSQGTLQGEGQVVCVCDTGFDMGDTTDVHPAFTSRVLKLYPLGRNTADDPNGHGTHVCGSVLSDGVMQDGTVIKGAAPAALLVMQSVLDSSGHLGGLPADLHNLFATPYTDDNVRVHSNSWGAPVGGRYTSHSLELDDFVWTNRDLVICVAAGNDGRDPAGTGVVALGSVGSPATAKNCIAVGASENNRPGFDGGGSEPWTYGAAWPSDFPAVPLNTDRVADNADGMAGFSSRGPAANNRVRPDVVAPGTAILSTKSRASTGNGWGPSSDPAYFFDGGTSMATPLVAGCAAVVRQCLIAEGIASPSAALVKAMLINGATALAGQYSPPEAGSPPDNNQGFGRINLHRTVGPRPQNETVSYKDEGTALETGQSERQDLPVVAGSTLKVTLVWSDISSEALQNDLDLVVVTPDGEERHGNMASGVADFDRSGNVEQVELEISADGGVQILVNAFRTIQPQTYALVVRVTPP